MTGTIPPEVAPAQDRAALRVFYDATGGANWTDYTNWLRAELLSEWYGVTTDADSRVTSLSLSANGLTGTIGAELGVLTRLTELQLNDNELTGTVPPEIENLTRLQVFDIRNTDLCVMPGSELHTWLATITFHGTVCATKQWPQRRRDPIVLHPGSGRMVHDERRNGGDTESGLWAHPRERGFDHSFRARDFPIQGQSRRPHFRSGSSGPPSLFWWAGSLPK